MTIDEVLYGDDPEFHGYAQGVCLKCGDPALSELSGWSENVGHQGVTAGHYLCEAHARDANAKGFLR